MQLIPRRYKTRLFVNGASLEVVSTAKSRHTRPNFELDHRKYNFMFSSLWESYKKPHFSECAVFFVELWAKCLDVQGSRPDPIGVVLFKDASAAIIDEASFVSVTDKDWEWRMEIWRHEREMSD